MLQTTITTTATFRNTQSPLQNTLLDQRQKLHELPMPLQASVQAALVKCTTENILHSKSASRIQNLLGIDLSFAGIYQTSTGDNIHLIH
jgi:hypothetical protein